MSYLEKLSSATRKQLGSRPKSFGDATASIYAARETRLIAQLAQTAVSMAAGERKRHGRDPSPEDRTDAAQDVLAALWADGQPKLSDLIDSERERVASGDGERENLRPGPELISMAGASLDRLYREREVLIDPTAGTGDLLRASAQHRQAAESRRSVATQLLDPTVSPVPPEVARSISVAGIWPDDPIRQAILDALVPDLTADDWAQAGERGTASAIRKRRQRAQGTLAVDPRARTFAKELRHEIGGGEADSERVLAGLIEANPDGAGSSNHSLPDPAWRTVQPRVYPVREVSADV